MWAREGVGSCCVRHYRSEAEAQLGTPAQAPTGCEHQLFRGYNWVLGPVRARRVHAIVCPAHGEVEQVCAAQPVAGCERRWRHMGKRPRPTGCRHQFLLGNARAKVGPWV